MGTAGIIEKLIEAIEAAEARGMTRYQLSQRTGIPQSTLSRLMRRERDSLKVETLETLCRELGFTLELRPVKTRRRNEHS
jgi:DNA-binding Xre family transcriptional regulator